MRKIFCVGRPKSGTHSLHDALTILGVKSTRSVPKIERVIAENLNSQNKLLDGYDEFEAYCDIVYDHYIRLNQDYPDSLFICTYRDPNEIALSCVRHYYARPQPNYVQWLNYSKMVTEAVQHYSQIFRYFFPKKDRFLIIRVCDGEGWDKLCPFLGLPIPTQKFPWSYKNSL